MTATAPPLRLFDLDGGPWTVTNRFDPIVAAIADRHYPRRHSSDRVGGPYRTLTLLAVDHSAAWVTGYPQPGKSLDGLDAWRCNLFRNEGDAVASDLITAAMRVTLALWQTPPPDRWVTYVDTAQVGSQVPGYCFRRAGWRRDRTYHPDRRRATLIRLTHR